jgi:hypothetical protein
VRGLGIIALNQPLSATIDKEAAMAISLLLMALQDAWLKIGKAAAQTPAHALQSDSAQD